MIPVHTKQTNAATTLLVREYAGKTLSTRLPALDAYCRGHAPLPLSRHPSWLLVLERGLGHVPYVLEAQTELDTCGFLPLALVKSTLFGRYLVSLPYVNYGGAVADNADTARLLIDRAVELAAELNVKYLELRHADPIAHPQLAGRMASKVHMRLPLPSDVESLWSGLHSKVRNQVRKGDKSGLTVAWGGLDLLGQFYSVFSRNMRDLGTPVYGREFFRCILSQFGERAELCVVRLKDEPIAGALLLHGWGITEVPSASSLREFNSTCANMLMYWHLLQRAIARGQGAFDFGRSTRGGPTYRFKEQWGAVEGPAEWQYHLRSGQLDEMRPENPKYAWRIRAWQKLPVSLTRLLGPMIVRGIP